MKLDRNLLLRCYHDTVILQYKKTLEKQGFIVFSEHKIFGMEVDLYAEKDLEKRVYEFKMIGNKKYIKGRLSKFKEVVESNGATPYIIYINPPTEKEIIFDDLGMYLTEYFMNEDLPSELDALSTHTTIDVIEIDELISIEISNSEISTQGVANINVELQYGSDADGRRGDGIEYTDNFPMKFDVKLEQDDDGYYITEIEYKIDTSSFYE